MRVMLLGLATAIAVSTSIACRSAADNVEELNETRGRVNEAAAVANLRLVLAAEAAYSGENAGLYGSLECLADPAPCVTGKPGQPYLEKSFLSGEQNGYVFEFHAGADAPQTPGRPPGSTLADFAIVARPTSSGSSGGRRFCGDSTMNVCTMAGDAIVTGAQCPSSCEPVNPIPPP